MSQTRNRLNRSSRGLEADLRRPDVPIMTVGRSYVGRPLPLGLDQALELLGGDRLGPDGVAAALSMDWLPALPALVASACSRQVAAGRSWFHMPPIAMVGAPADEALHLARSIARQAGVPLAVFDVSRRDSASMAMRSLAEVDAPVPPVPLLAMAASSCANPIVLVTGVADATETTYEALGAMLDGDTSQRWNCEVLGCVFDLGQISWVVSMDQEHALPESLYVRLLSTPIAPPKGWNRKNLKRQRGLSILLEAAADLQMRPEEVATLSSSLLDGDEWGWAGDRPAGDIYDAAVTMLRKAVYDFRHQGAGSPRAART